MRKYAIKTCPKLSDKNKEDRKHFAEKLVVDKVLDPKTMIITDETAIICYPRVGNRHKWASCKDQPTGLAVTTSHSWTIQCFAAIGVNYKSELLFLIDETVGQRGARRGQRVIKPVNITAEIYQDRILETLDADFRSKGLVEDTPAGPKLKRYYQQDGAQPHRANSTIRKLDSLWGLENCVTQANGHY